MPLKLPDAHAFSFKAHVALWTRRIAWVGFVALDIVFPLVLFVGFGALSRTTTKRASELFQSWALDQLGAYWTAPVAALLLGVGTAFFWHRYAEPYLSDFFRRYRVKQAEGERSDVTKEASKLETRTYDPRAYYRPGVMFLGLDEANQPIYVPDDEFRELMVATIGPTGVGKGVSFQIVGDQAVDKGWRVFFIDPKDDDNTMHVLAQAAARNKRPFVFLDLNPGGQGNWHPFKGGLPRDRRSRMVSAFKLAAAGSDADVYKASERRILDKALAKTDGSIRQLFECVDKEAGDSNLNTLRDTLNEWLQISTFVPPKKNAGHSIEKSLRNNAVVYVRGSTSDEVIRLATRCYLAEVLQEIKRLKPELTKGHTLVQCDEVRFIMSKELVDGLATIRSSDANIMAGTQAISDLRNISDRDVDKEALQQSFTINCKVKLIYQAADVETARWAEEMSGSTWIRTATMERTEVNRYGGEKWGDQRSMKDEEVALISQNRLLMLKKRVGVLYRPGVPATTLFTSFVPLKNPVRYWEHKADEKEKPEERVEAAAEVDETSVQADDDHGLDVNKL